MPKFELRPTTVKIQQMLAESYKRNPHIALLTLKTGGGKTYSAIHTAACFNPNTLLIVFTTSKVMLSHQWEDSVKDYNQATGSNLLIICYNYEKLTSEKFRNLLFKKIVACHGMEKMLILDEIHKIKLSSSGKLSQRSKWIQKLAKANDVSRVLGLSATAFSNSYLDVTPYLVMGRYYTSKTDFMRQHVRYFDNYHNPIVSFNGHISRNAFKDPDRIDKEIADITVYMDTSQYMPDLTVEHDIMKLNSAQRQAYDSVDGAYADGIFEYPIQASMEQERILAEECYEAKDLRLLQILKDRDNGKFGPIAPLLIFYQYTKVCKHVIKMIQSMRPDLPIHQVNGFSKDTLLKPNDDTSVYLVQYEAGGEGLDWQWSNISVFYEAPVRYEKYVQAKGRNLRNRELMEKVYHFEFEYQNTVDSSRWSVNRDKKDFTDDVMSKTFLENQKKKGN